MKEIKQGVDGVIKFELDYQDLAVIRQMYLDRLQENGLDLGPEMWFYVIVRFLESRGYDITKVKGNK